MEYIIPILLLVNTALLAVLLFKKTTSKLDNSISEEFSRNRKEISDSVKSLRLELTDNLEKSRDKLDVRLEKISEKNDSKLEEIKLSVEKKVESMRKDNSQQLDKMRQTVDEKLQSTLEKRLGESFKIVSERLEKVQRGLGEMQNLATDVSDFKRVLTNVKTRGTWGEVQLENLLEQIFVRDHYEKQVALSNSSKETVDFAIRLPDKNNQKGFIYLPIDAKFPLEDYQRLVVAQEKSDAQLVATSTKSLTARIKLEAKGIKEKYIKPPKTTDFAILYVPIEGLYAEILREPGLFESLQRNYRVTIAGPTTIAAILNSYQLGFRTLAIAERTSQVWELLTEVKGDFTKFGDLLEKAKEKIDQAGKTLDTASGKSRRIESRLGKVQQLAENISDKSIGDEGS